MTHRAAIAETLHLAPVSPARWAETLSGRPILDQSLSGSVPALVRRWQDIEPDIEQSALDQHFISVHLGGPKHLVRRGEGQCLTRDATDGAYSVVPAGSAFQWQTRGPIDFLHIYIDPKTVDDVVIQAFDRDPLHVRLEESLGESDSLVRPLVAALIDELGHDDRQSAYLDDLMHLLLCRVLRRHSNARSTSGRGRHALAPFRMRRAVDFIEAHFSGPVGVAEIAAASGISRYHFSRAFRQTTGRSPYSFVLERRMASAKTMLMETDLSFTVIATTCGFTSLSQFSRMFKRQTGISPTCYRERR